MATYIKPDAIKNASIDGSKIKNGTLSASKIDETIASKVYVDTQVKTINGAINSFKDAGYLYAGVATPNTNPSTSDAKVFYIANGKGTYTNFGGIEVTEDDVVVLYWDTAWHKVATGIASQAKLSELKEKVDALALGAFYGYFPDSTSLPTDVTIPGYSYVGLDNPYKIWNFNGESWSDSGTSIDMNDADEEDITRNVDGKLQFKDRSYGDGMGYVILRKDKTFAEQVTKENTIYEIRYEFDINNETVTIPNNCILKFNGGKLNNASIIGNNTEIIAGCFSITSNVRLEGSWKAGVAYSTWFAVSDCILDSSENFISGTDNYQSFVNLFKFDNIEFQKGQYYMSGTIYLHSGQTINGNGAIIKCKYSSPEHGSFMVKGGVSATRNICIRNLNICGWKYEGNDATEWQASIKIHGNVANCILDNCVITKNRGDGITLSGYFDSENNLLCQPENIKICNCLIDDNSRNGISLIAGKLISINNCHISNTNTPDGIAAKNGPFAGIDIEPDESSHYPTNVKYVTITNCSFQDNARAGLLFGSSTHNREMNKQDIHNIIVDNCELFNNHIDIYLAEKITIKNTNINYNKLGYAIILEEFNQYNITFENITILGTNSSTCGHSNAIFIIRHDSEDINKQYLTFKNIYLKGAYHYGFFIPSNSSNKNIKNVTLENIYISNVYYGFLVQDTTDVVYHNILTENLGKNLEGQQYIEGAGGWPYPDGQRDDISTRIDLDTLRGK